jgi:hypothetical protein
MTDKYLSYKNNKKRRMLTKRLGGEKKLLEVLERDCFSQEEKNTVT